MRMPLRLLSIVGACAFAFAGWAPAAEAAEPPVLQGSFSFPVDETDNFLCAFPLQVSGHFTGHFTELSRGGTVSKVIIHFSNEYTVSANGISLPQIEHWNVVTLFDDSGNPVSDTLTGLIVQIRLPHGGTVGLDVGRIVENPVTGDVLFQAGNFQLASGDTAALCAAFA